MKTVKRIFWLIIAICILLFAYYRIWFLRQPVRNILQNNAVFVAPANGKVVSVSKWNTASLTILKKELGIINVWTKDVDTAGTIISIQMDVYRCFGRSVQVA